MMENAFSEVYTILRCMPQTYYEMVPLKILELLETKRNREYFFLVDTNKKITEQPISEEAKAILANFYKYYWCSDEKREELLKIDEEYLSVPVYKREETFQQNNLESLSDALQKTEDIKLDSDNDAKKSLVEVKKTSSFFLRMIDKIKHFFSK